MPANEIAAGQTAADETTAARSATAVATAVAWAGGGGGGGTSVSLRNLTRVFGGTVGRYLTV